MSYSRWSNSIWYTFWSASSPVDNMDEQQFEICDFCRSMTFTYKDLKTNINDCLEKVKTYYSQKKQGKILKDFKTMTYDTFMSEPIYLTDNQLQELKEYMLNFIKDIEEEYHV